MQHTLSIRDGYFFDDASLFHWLVDNFPEQLPSSEIQFDFNSTDYDAVRRTIERQIPAQNSEIAAEQRTALTVAAETIRASREWMSHTIVELSRRYGYRAASRTTCIFASHCLLDTLRYLSRYQVVDGTEVLFDYSVYFYSHEWAPIRSLLVHRSTELLEITVSEDEGRVSSQVFLEPDEVENSGSGTLYANIKDDVINIPLHIWLDFVVPQCTFKKAGGVTTYFQWSPEAGTYVTDGNIWSLAGGEAVARTRRDIPPHVIRDAASRTTGRDARIYLHCSKDPPAETIGPLTLLRRGMHLPSLEAQTIQLREIVKRIDRRTWRAPSVWHAAAWLSDLVGWERKGRPRDAFSEDTDLVAMARGALLFRGQADAIWDIVPKIARPDYDTEQSKSALVRFMLAVSHLQYEADKTTQPPEAAIGAGQHYGLATNLIDFTVDPLVAAFFAVDSQRPDLSPDAVVYWLPLYRAYALGAKIVLPPYWVERLYVQRGCFLDSYAFPAETNFKSECFSILFPRDRTYCSSDFGNTNKRLYPESVWLQKAVDWAQESAASSGLPHLNYHSYADELVRWAGPADFIAGSLNPDNVDKQRVLLVDLIEWLSLTLGETDGRRTLKIDCQVVQAIAGQNPGIFVAVREIGKYLPETESLLSHPDKFIKYFAAMVRCLQLTDAGTQ